MVVYDLDSTFSPRDVLKGAIAGLIATIPMTISMLIGWRLLPQRERYPLPPREITGEVVERLGKADELSEAALMTATLLSHFAYGAVSGCTYAVIEQNFPLGTFLKGSLAGFILWVGSYLGWLLAVGILKPATHRPWRRNLLMILAHILWGVTLGEITQKFKTEKQ
jgi:uncharacterized membrane protein YagU involved in acid resistance